LSKSAGQAELSPSWKLEVNRKLAAHRSRKDSRAGEPETSPNLHHEVSRRGAQAAARVAARYAQAPSYSEALAGDARAAVRAAKAASRAAQEAHEAAQMVLEGLEAASGVEHNDEPFEDFQPAVRSSNHGDESQSLAIFRDPELPAHASDAATTRPTHGLGAFRIPEEQWFELGPPARDEEAADANEAAESAQPIAANLIEFPRELVATRKMRPRLVEGPFGAARDAEEQLSIFEVDPGSISTQPAALAVPGPEWSGIQLEEEPLKKPAYFANEAAAEATTSEPSEAETSAVPLHLAHFSLRLMAAVVDGALIAGAFLAAAVVIAANAKELPSIRTTELGAAIALALIFMLYQALFFTFGEATPGMKYAHLSLCTFDDQRPTRAQLRGRFGALLLSLLPVGLGVAWIIFDEEHLSWHDRLSGTYLRKN
jgi:uncharacterized RDD family membrane protein YckC